MPRARCAFWWIQFAVLTVPMVAAAGPPYVTDDPEPVELRHFEIYLASLSNWDSSGWQGTAPHLEVNYGAHPDLQLHTIVPGAYVVPSRDRAHYGVGDIELGAKVRFVHETRWIPQIGTFVLAEIPTGDAAKGLGAGHMQVFLPLWLQKSFGAWTSYGGFGYWLNSGIGNRNWWFVGWQVQRHFGSKVAIGAEIFHTTPKDSEGTDETRLNIGLVLDLTDLHHLLFSAGRGIQGPNRFQGYVAYQITFGLGKKQKQ